MRVCRISNEPTARCRRKSSCGQRARSQVRSHGLIEIDQITTIAQEYCELEVSGSNLPPCRRDRNRSPRSVHWSIASGSVGALLILPHKHWRPTPTKSALAQDNDSMGGDAIFDPDYGIVEDAA